MISPTKLVLILYALIIVFIVGMSSAGAVVTNDIRDSVVIVTCLDEKKEPLKFGTGTVVSDWQVLTAAHVVKGCSFLVTTFFSSDERPAAVQVQGSPDDFDFAILNLSVPQGVPSVPLATHNPEQGEHLTFIAHPRGLTWTRVEATVSLLSKEPDNDMLVDVTSAQGASGGAMLNSDGEIVGILVAGLMSGPNDGDYTGFGVVELISNIRKFLPEDLQ